jgi:nicotinamidase-related amidase
MDINKSDTAVLVTDPQNDFLSEKGVTWELVGDSVKENKTIDNIERLFQAAKKNGFEVFISPHYYYPTDHGWKFGGTVEKIMHEINMFGRGGALSLEGFRGSGADWLERYKPFIEDGKTIVASPHKVYGPENNDLALQLRKRGIDKVILAGMSANLCVEGQGRDGGCPASRAGRRLQGRARQLRLYSQRGPVNGRGRGGHGVTVCRRQPRAWIAAAVALRRSGCRSLRQLRGHRRAV